MPRKMTVENAGVVAMLEGRHKEATALQNREAFWKRAWQDSPYRTRPDFVRATIVLRRRCGQSVPVAAKRFQVPRGGCCNPSATMEEKRVEKAATRLKGTVEQLGGAISGKWVDLVNYRGSSQFDLYPTVEVTLPKNGSATAAKNAIRKRAERLSVSLKFS